MSTDTFSQSKIKAFRRCRKIYDYKYNQGLTRRTAPATLSRGVTFHEMLDAPVMGKDWREPLEKYRQEYQGLWSDETENYSSPEELESLYLRYHKHWANDGLDYRGLSEIPIETTHRGIKFKGIIDKLPRDQMGRVWLMDHKCLHSDHLVHTLRGMIRMGDLKLDDHVVSSSGEFIPIDDICHQTLPGYEIRLKGGKSFRATAEHRWPALVGTRSGRVSYRIIDTQSMMDYPVVYLLPSPPIRGLSPREYGIHPYVLGALLGDGSFTQGVRFCCPESELLGEVVKHLKGTSIKKISPPGKADSYYLSGLRGKVRRLGLNGSRSWEKHIPPEYLMGDESQRWDLLCGLMDTDGSVYKGSSYLYITTSRRLLQDVQNLIQGLGGITLVRSPKSNKYQGGKDGRTSYQVKFTLPERFGPPFRLTRKFLQAGATKKVRFGTNLRVQSVRPIGDIPVTDITVGSEDHLFSCEGVLTHNTHKILPDEDARFSDIQTVLYYWALREEGEQVDGVMWDYIRTKPPAVPETLKSGGLSKRANIDTDYDTYLGEIQRLGLNPADYQDILTKLKQGKKVFFQRVKLPTPSETLVNSVVNDFFNTAEQILEATTFERNMTRDCKSCSYYQLCSAEIRGLDSEFIKRQLFTIRTE